MGSRSKIHEAYIAGFLDGDGSLMLQLKKRSDTARGYRFMTTICLYQDTRHEEHLLWMRQYFGIGYVSKRNDGISELRVNGFTQCKRVLEQLIPHIRFKKVQANNMYKACVLLEKIPFKNLTKKQLEILVSYMVAIQNANYVTKYKRTKAELYEVLGLTP